LAELHVHRTIHLLDTFENEIGGVDIILGFVVIVRVGVSLGIIIT